MWWRVKVIELYEIVDSHAFEHEDDISNVGSLDFRYGRLFKFLFIGPEGKESKTFSRGNSTSSTGSLISGCLTYGDNNKTIHTRSGIVGGLLDKSAIYYINNVVNSQRGLSDICGQNYFTTTFWGRLEYFGLHVTRQSRING
jgi:hypothetical protein